MQRSMDDRFSSLFCKLDISHSTRLVEMMQVWLLKELLAGPLQAGADSWHRQSGIQKNFDFVQRVSGPSKGEFSPSESNIKSCKTKTKHPSTTAWCQGTRIEASSAIHEAISHLHPDLKHSSTSVAVQLFTVAMCQQQWRFHSNPNISTIFIYIYNIYIYTISTA